MVRRVEGAEGAAAEVAATAAAAQRRHGVAGQAPELPAGSVEAGAVAPSGGAAAAHQEGADGDSRRRGGWIRPGRPAAAGDAAAAQLPLRRHAHAPGRRLKLKARARESERASTGTQAHSM